MAKRNGISRRVSLLEQVYIEDRERWRSNDERWRKNDARLRRIERRNDERWRANSERVDRVLDILGQQSRKLDETMRQLKEEVARADARWRIIHRGKG